MVAIVEDCHIPKTTIEVRRGNAILSYLWKCPSSEGALARHLEEFSLSPVSPDGPEVAFLVSMLPDEWEKPESDAVVCYAQAAGMPAVPEGGTRVILVQDNRRNQLICYYYFNF